jgi:hypothetical protein
MSRKLVSDERFEAKLNRLMRERGIVVALREWVSRAEGGLIK